MLLSVSSQGKIPHSPFFFFFKFLSGLLGFIFACLIVFGFLPQNPVGSSALRAFRGAEGLACHRVTHRGGNLLSVHLPFSLPSPLSQGETASAKWFPLPNEERSEESSYLRVVVFSNGKLRGPVSMLTSSQGLQQAFCCPVSSF